MGVRFESEGPSEDRLQRRNAPLRRPELELRVSGRNDAQQIVVGTQDHVDRLDALRVTAVQAFRNTQHRCERFDRAA